MLSTEQICEQFMLDEGLEVLKHGGVGNNDL